MKQHNFSLNTHIGGWYIPDKVCDDLINYFSENENMAFKGSPDNEPVNLNKVDDKRLPLNKEDNILVFENYKKYLSKCLGLYKKKFEFSDKVPPYSLSKLTSLQKYEPGQGFKYWHFEDDGQKNNDGTRRHLVFMTYLNDVDDGGTNFLYQNITTPAKKGLTLIWPSHWTHTHKGQISNTKTKYIITGWFDFYDS